RGPRAGRAGGGGAPPGGGGRPGPPPPPPPPPLGGGPLFRQVREDGTVLQDGLSAHSIRAIVQRCAKDAGIKGAVRGHSLRVGAAQSLAGAGAELVEMQVVGRWKSPGMPARYARAEIAGRSAVARLRYGK
ncbi:MAG: tyrosine-type recombinase/integrase, partial [Gammaproteobacteria bacterium]|nr:tyrosine-type recombinase/integrase [Gammaproteobacteria bacterium]